MPPSGTLSSLCLFFRTGNGPRRFQGCWQVTEGIQAASLAHGHQPHGRQVPALSFSSEPVCLYGSSAARAGRCSNALKINPDSLPNTSINPFTCHGKLNLRVSDSFTANWRMNGGSRGGLVGPNTPRSQMLQSGVSSSCRDEAPPPSPGWWEAPPGDREAARKPQTPKGSDSWSTWSLVSQVRATVPHGSHSPSLEGAGKVRPLAGKADGIQGWGHCLGKSWDRGVPLG